MAQENMTNTKGVQGKIVQCIGAVVDVEFPRDQMPRVYDALKMEGSALTLEVQQQLGDGIVRTIALGSSDGLRRGMMVTNTAKRGMSNRLACLSWTKAPASAPGPPLRYL